MTRINGTSRSNGNDPQSEVLILHRQHDEWRLLSASMINERVTVLTTETLSANAPNELQKRIEEIAADQVIVVLPGGSVVCRPMDLPAMEPDMLGAAMELQAETVLPANLPRHRWAATAWPWKTASGSPVAVAVGWPGSVAALGLPENNLDGHSENEFDPTFVAESVCLLELLTTNSGRGFAAYADRENGSIEFVLHHDGPTLIRTARLASGDWSRAAGQMMMETCLGGGLDDEAIDPLVEMVEQQCAAEAQTLVLSDDLRTAATKKIAGAQPDSQWWSQYGVAAGAACTGLGSRRVMAGLRDKALPQPRNPVIKLAEWIAPPQRTVAVIIASLILLVGAPLVSAMTRAWLLDRKTQGSEVLLKDASTLELEAYFFKLLHAHRWPMTKLLADISGAAPYEIEFSDITLVQSSKKVMIKGTAPLGGGEIVTTFVLNLTSGQNPIFGVAVLDDYQEKGNLIVFEVSAEIKASTLQFDRPFPKARVAFLYGDSVLELPSTGYDASEATLDFGETGETGLLGNANPSGGDGIGSLFGEPDAGTPLFTSPGNRRLSTGSSRASRSTPPNDGVVPPPLTKEEINKMTSKAEITQALTSRSSLRNEDWVEQEDRERIKREVAWLMRRFVEVKSAEDKKKAGDH